jgi:nitrogen regulatory protein P-II 1
MCRRDDPEVTRIRQEDPRLGDSEKGGHAVKLITAVIRPHRLEEVKEALQEAGVQGMTVTEVQGHGRQRGHSEVYRGTEYTVEFVPKVKLEIIADVFDAERILAVIADAARTGQIGDGKAWVSELEGALRIRTGERDQEAIR